MTKRDVIPEWFYQKSKLFKGKNLWIPVSSSPRQSLSRGLQYLKTWIPDKRFREWRRGWIPWMPLSSSCLSLLDASIVPLSVTPEWFYHLLLVTPEWFYQGSMVLKTKEKSKNLDSRLKLSGMTAGGHSWVFLSGIYIMGGGIPMVLKRKNKNLDAW